MSAAAVTLTTDFGHGSPYVAALKGALLSVNPRARLVDLSHEIGPQDLRHAGFFLASCVPYFPPDTIHVVVVDPGVGTDRALLCVETAGQVLLVPDNGCWTPLARPTVPVTVYKLQNTRYWRAEVSATFHGRDVLAPVAGHLSLGLDPRQLGPRVHDWVTLPASVPVLADEYLVGEVAFVDRYGNLISNIPGRWYRDCGAGPVRVTVGEQEVPARVRTYGEAAAGALVALVSSVDTLEVAVVRGNAAERLGAKVGSVVRVQRLG